MIRIKILYDNYPAEEDFITGWGFSCLIQIPHQNILFDTGGDSHILLYNFNKAKIDPKIINKIVISHYHGDHTGGLNGLFSLLEKFELYMGNFSYEYLSSSLSQNIKVQLIKDKPLEIYSGILSTEELGSYIKEISLILRTEKGFILITGCAHPGIINILQRAIEIAQDKPFMILGGLHLLSKNKSEIKNIIEFFKSCKLRYIAASHCTGDKAREMFREAFKENFINAGVGKEIILEG